MSWASIARRAPTPTFVRPQFVPSKVDWARLVTLDYETYFDQDYTLKKLTTSEYIRDPRFKAHMVGIKVGSRKTKVVPTARIKDALHEIDWSTHSLLCHHTQFDGFILQYRYGVIPKFYYDTLSMARGWLANDIGAGLDEVAQHFGRGAKHPDVLDMMRGVHTLAPQLYKTAAAYCANDCDMTLAIFKEDLLQHFPQEELDLIDATCQMFCCPVLRLDEDRARKAMEQEIAERERLLMSVSPEGIELADMSSAHRRELLAEKPAPTPRDIQIFSGKKLIGSNERFADLLRTEGIEPPTKISPAWIKKPPAERTDDGKYAYAFAQTDLEFKELLEHPDMRVRDLVETRLAVKSNINITRAGRLLASGIGGRPVPVYYKYAGAHTWRFSGGDRCLAGDTKILIRRASSTKEIAIEGLRATDRVWDGQEFVTHGGLICRGEQEVMTYQGVTATPDHEVYVDGYASPLQIQHAARQGLELQSTLGLAGWARLRKNCQIAKDRCTNPRHAAYKDYGGRGVTFDFRNGSDMAEWVLKHLGPRPSPIHSIDRSDNSGGYAANNLRWATKTEQANNKRNYVAWKYGERLRELMRLKPEYGYERLREFIKQGLTNEEILTRQRGKHKNARVRHC